MLRVRAFLQRVPMGPVVIALLMVGVLTLVNLYGSKGAAEHAAPSQPVGIPPQLPVEEHAMPSPAATSDAPAAPPPAPTPEAPAPPSEEPRASAATRPAATAPATRAPSTPAPVTPTPVPNPPQQPFQGATEPRGSGNSSGPDGEHPNPYAVPTIRVVEVVLTSSAGKGAKVRCNDREEVQLTATIKVDGGAGGVVFQWYFDGIKSWTPDVLIFTGTGPRQQSLSIPWKVGINYSGAKVRGTVQLRILQPAVNAQTQKIAIDLVCL